METPEGVQVVPTGRAEPNPDEIEQIVEARLPLFENPRKAEYLANRAVGFSIREASALAHVTQHTISDWRRNDPVFAQWEGERLTYLQTNLASIVTEAKWMRNFMLFLILDGKIAQKGAFNRHNLTEFEQGYIKGARREYSGQGAIAIARAFGDAEPDDDGKGGDINIGQAIVIVDGKEVTAVEAKQAASAQLLKQFTTNRSKYLPDGEDETLEGEVVNVDGG